VVPSSAVEDESILSWCVDRSEFPYFSQFASADLIGDFVSRRMSIRDDPRWASTGARTADEYRRWALAGCGMACLQMLLAATGRSVPGLVELGRECQAAGGYRERDDGGLDGLFYAEFAAYLGAAHGLVARVAAPLSTRELLTAAAGEEVVLASVHHSIRTPEIAPPERGGHLVLVIDADLDTEKVRFHNPSGHTGAMQRDAVLNARTFGRFYAERGVAVTLARG
jgi:hypothetical protein